MDQNKVGVIYGPKAQMFESINKILSDRMPVVNLDEPVEFKTGQNLEKGDMLVDWDELPKTMRTKVRKYWEKLQGDKYKNWTFERKIEKLKRKFNLKIVDE